MWGCHTSAQPVWKGTPCAPLPKWHIVMLPALGSIYMRKPRPRTILAKKIMQLDLSRQLDEELLVLGAYMLLIRSIQKFSNFILIFWVFSIIHPCIHSFTISMIFIWFFNILFHLLWSTKSHLYSRWHFHFDSVWCCICYYFPMCHAWSWNQGHVWDHSVSCIGAGYMHVEPCNTHLSSSVLDFKSSYNCHKIALKSTSIGLQQDT